MKFEIKDFISKLVSFQSVSADSSKASQVAECADFLARSLNSFGFDAKINKTAKFVDACHEYGMKVGLYLSPWDCNHPDVYKRQTDV